MVSPTDPSSDEAGRRSGLARTEPLKSFTSSKRLGASRPLEPGGRRGVNVSVARTPASDPRAMDGAAPVRTVVPARASASGRSTAEYPGATPGHRPGTPRHAVTRYVYSLQTACAPLSGKPRFRFPRLNVISTGPETGGSSPNGRFTAGRSSFPPGIERTASRGIEPNGAAVVTPGGTRSDGEPLQY